MVNTAAHILRAFAAGDGHTMEESYTVPGLQKVFAVHLPSPECLKLRRWL